jgi:alkyldihydroxyacetonephosphate synthase
VSAAGRTRSWWGWGWDEAALTGPALDGIGAMLATRFGRAADASGRGPVDPVDPHTVEVAPPRASPPRHLAALTSDAPVDRLRHGHGAAFRELVRALHGDIPTPPDLVVRPRDAADVARVLDWCADAGIVVVPWGGGTSVVGGVTPPADAGPVVSLDLEHLDGVLEVDERSQHARIQGGATGPAIERQLAERGLTFRHFPQSWEFSTLGGWVVTRAGGHFATGPTHVDDLVAAVTAETPTGRWTSRRLPGSGAGPSPDRWLLGSEGILGVVTEAWVRVQPRPRSRASATLAFPSVPAGLEAVRAIAQVPLEPANCRLLDPVEAALAGAAPPDGQRTLLVLGFEAVDGPLTERLALAIEVARDHGGEVLDGPSERRGDVTGAVAGGAGAWRQAFLRGPYLRDAIARLGGVAETFETATTWDRAADLIATLRDTAEAAATAVCGDALVAVRTTHAYVDGIAPYLTVVAPGPAPPSRRPHSDEPGERVARGRTQAAAWDEVKVAVSDAIDAAGATVTHHHAVGRDHRPWYDRQRPEPFARALAAVKRELDPTGVLNPGVLVDVPVRSGRRLGVWTPPTPS